MATILVVEDNKEMALALQYNLELEGHAVEVAFDGAAGLDLSRSARPDLVVLDLMLPGIDGYAVLERLRRDGLRAPVLILTAKGEEADKVRGFRAGADQYLVKPFGLLELLERVRGLLRRWCGDADERPVIHVRDVEIDLAARVVRRADEEVVLSPKAFDLLVALARRNGAVGTRLDLMREVWGHKAAVMSRTVDAHVAELRRKLDRERDGPELVVTVWKSGYRLNV